MTSLTATEPSPLQSPYESLERQLAFLLHAVGVNPIDDLGWLRVTGSDRVRWLNGMVTNSIQDLRSGEGNYSFALNAQGQIQGDLNTFASDEDSLLLQTAKDRVQALMAMFDRFIIMDDVELKDISPSRLGCAVTGPLAAELLRQTGLDVPAQQPLNSLAIATQQYHDSMVHVVAANSPLVPHFELWADAATIDMLLAELTVRAAALGGGRVETASLELLRVLEGTPRFGTDIHEKTLAQETGQTRALHFSKGCYLGQEIVERIRSRGNIHRLFTAFHLDGPLPAVGTSIIADGKSIAELTTVATIPLSSGTIQIGLGLARREAIERGATLTYTVDTASGTAVPTAIPISPPR